MFVNDTFCPNCYFKLNIQYASDMTYDNLKRVLRHASWIFNIVKCSLKFLNEIKAGIIDSESLI